MKSKLRTILICIAGAGLGAQAYATTPPAATSNGTINITGKVTDTSCSLDSAGASTSVKLPSVNKSLLSTAGSSTGVAGFSLSVTGCSDGVKVSAAFVPNSHVDANGNLKNSASDTPASNVQVQVLDKNHEVININTDDNTKQMARAVEVSGAATPVNLQYYLRYYSEAGGAVAGNVIATANFQLTYE